MEIILDLSGVSGAQGIPNPLAVMWTLLTHGGWIALIPVFLWGGFAIWLNYIQGVYAMRQKYVLLAIDVPKENELSPKAVEQVFAHLSGIYKSGNKKERYLRGYLMPSLSLELVSIEGYVQFLIRTPAKFRDLVEATIYAQYPNAEISEVGDYATEFKAEFPNEEYDIWGTELKLTNKQHYPIRTYPMFEHSLSQTFYDPMASILEFFSRMQRGEQVWLQIVITPPRTDDWRKDGMRLVKKLIGARGAPSGMPGYVNIPSQVLRGIYETAAASVIAPGTSEERRNEENQPPSLMLHLPPNERAVVEQVGMKISKIGWLTKMRLIYIGKHGVFTKDRISPLMGALRQFNTLDMNGFTLDSKTKTNIDYFVNPRVNWRKRRLMLGYKYRSNWRGRNLFIMNVEELATIFHFPVTTVVKAPRVQKTEAKRGEPPAALPVESEFQRVRPFTPGQSAFPPPAERPAVELPTIVTPPELKPTPPRKGGHAPGNLPV